MSRCTFRWGGHHVCGLQIDHETDHICKAKCGHTFPHGEWFEARDKRVVIGNDGIAILHALGIDTENVRQMTLVWNPHELVTVIVESYVPEVVHGNLVQVMDEYQIVHKTSSSIPDATGGTMPT